MACDMHIFIIMKIYKSILVCMLSLLLSACIGGILVNGDGDVGAPTLQIASGDSQIVLGWTPDTAFPEPEGYELNRDGVQIFDSDATVTAYNDSDPTNGTRVCYTVSALIGENIATSAQRCATPMAGATLAVTNQSLGAILDWAAVSGAVSYNLYFLDPVFSLSLPKGMNKATGDDPINVVGPPYTVTGLSNNCVTYPVEIRAVDIDGNEGVASTQDVEPDTEGTLDTTFGGGNGYVDIAAAGQFSDIAVMGDGTILGLRDMIGVDTLTAYGEDGDVLWEVAFAGGAHAMSFVSSLAIDSEGRILAGGASGTTPKVCRLIPSGGAYDFDDAEFGDGVHTGCSEISAANGIVNDITFDSQNRIVVAGQQTLATFLAVWVLINDGVDDGHLDASFDGGGEYLYPAAGLEGFAVETLYDGSHERIYVAGESVVIGAAVVLEIIDDNPPNAPTVNQSNDPAADGGARAIRILDDGDLLIAGYRTVVPRAVYSWLYSDFASPFTYAPVVATTEIAARSLDVDCHERSVVAGHLNDGANNQMMVMRTDETLAAVDADFADVGWYIDNAALGGFGLAIARDSLGRLLVGGQTDPGGVQNPRLWRMK